MTNIAAALDQIRAIVGPSGILTDAADMARVIRGEKPADFTPEHDLAVQAGVLRAAAAPVDA